MGGTGRLAQNDDGSQRCTDDAGEVSAHADQDDQPGLFRREERGHQLSEARAQFLVEHGIEEADQNGTGIIVTDLATMYQGESFYPDMLRFEVGLMDFNKYGGDFVFRVTKADTGQSVAMAKYGFVFFNYKTREVTPMPESFRARFAG